MEQIELKAEKRTVLGKKVKRLRAEGIIPAILYGHKVESIPIQGEEGALSRVLAQAGTNRLIALMVGWARKPRMALIRDIQLDAITRSILHVDIYEIVETERVRAKVGLTFVGEAPMVTSGEGMLLHGVDEVEIECLPGDLVHSIEVDLADLREPGDVIQVKDLRVPDGVEITTDGEEFVVKTLWMRMAAEEEEEIEAEEAVEPGEVETIAKGKAAKEPMAE